MRLYLVLKSVLNNSAMEDVQYLVKLGAKPGDIMQMSNGIFVELLSLKRIPISLDSVAVKETTDKHVFYIPASSLKQIKQP